MLTLAVVLVSVTGCVPVVSRYLYLSFEEVPGVVVRSVSPIEVENLVIGSTILVEYSLAREGYRLSIGPRSYSPNATIELVDSPGVRLVPPIGE